MYLIFRDGVAPRRDLFDQDFARFRAENAQLKALDKKLLDDSRGGNCRLFINTYQKLRGHIDAGLAQLRQLPEDAKLYTDFVLPVSRLTILTQIAVEFQGFVENDAEAGIGFLDPEHSRLTCSGPERAQWKAATLATFQALVSSAVHLLGVPGLRQMDQMDVSLAQRMDTKASRDNYLGGARNIGWFTLSVGALKVMWPTVSAISWAGRAVIAFVGAAGEYGAMVWTDNHVFFKEDAILANRLDMTTWKDFLVTAEDDMGAPLNSPQLYAQFLMELHGRLSRLEITSLSPWQQQLEDAEIAYGSIDQAAKVLLPQEVPVAKP
jgi:hypothetical protein